jgi:hypothetical protein
MNGYLWFLAARVHAARAQEAHHRPEPRTSRGVY